jgi:hypothetical protein
VIVLLAACAQDPVDSGPGGGPGPDPGTSEPTSSIDAPPIDEALTERCADPSPNRLVMPLGDDLRRVTLSDAAARCNDGTPPVLYVRSATDPAHARDWVVHLMGGGYCESHETCAARWCAEDNYDAGNMSTRWAPTQAGGRGMLAPGADNVLGGWNAVEVYYCTSDLFIGQQGELVFDGDPSQGTGPYALYFSGHDLLSAALDALDAGVASDDGAEALQLADPATLVFSGSSAGAYGAIAELGRVADRYPSARVVAAPDSIFAPAVELLPPDLAASFDLSVERRYDEVIAPVYDGYVDEGCLAAGEAAWRCANVDVVVREHRAVDELLYHHDLLDPVIYDFLSAAGIEGAAYAGAGETTLRLYGELGMSVHGSACADHTAFDESESWFGQAVTDALAGPPSATPNEALATVLGGGSVIAVDRPGGTGSVCP